MNSQITLLIVRAALSAGMSIAMQPQVEAGPVSAEVRQMCHGEVLKLCGAHVPNFEAVFRCAADNADRLPLACAPLVAGAPPR